eukprot:1798154-Rhodomonas_salina.1
MEEMMITIIMGRKWWELTWASCRTAHASSSASPPSPTTTHAPALSNHHRRSHTLLVRRPIIITVVAPWLLARRNRKVEDNVLIRDLTLASPDSDLREPSCSCRQDRDGELGGTEEAVEVGWDGVDEEGREGSQRSHEELLSEGHISPQT